MTPQRALRVLIWTVWLCGALAWLHAIQACTAMQPRDRAAWEWRIGTEPVSRGTRDGRLP